MNRDIMHWKMKGCIQKLLSSVPGGGRVNDRLQMLGGLRRFEHNVSNKVSDWKLTCQYLSDAKFQISDATIVEIGTGWYPVLPICFSLAGAKCLYTYDIHRHLNPKLTQRALTHIEPHLGSMAISCAAEAGGFSKNYEQLHQASDIGQLLRRARIEYRAPADARKTGLPDNSVDLVYSNSVFEHVPRQAILEILQESQRILKPSGLALHNIGCNDHYAFFDKSISFVNYLQFSESEWRPWNNSLQYQNRLRAPEFLELAEEAGLKVISKRTHVREGSREALATLAVAPEFKRFSHEELAATTLDFIAQKIA